MGERGGGGGRGWSGGGGGGGGDGGGGERGREGEGGREERARLSGFIWQTRNDEQNWIRKPISLSQLSEMPTRSLMLWIP